MATILDTVTLSMLRSRGFRSEYVPTEVGRMHALVAPGQGRLPPAVLLHGVSARGSQYSPLIRYLQPHVQAIVLPDAPGHGLSDPAPSPDPSLLTLGSMQTLDKLLDQPFLLYGNSLGGYLAIKYAVTRPERVRALVVNSPSGAPVDESRREALKALYTPADLRTALELVARTFPRRRLSLPLLAWLARRQLQRPFIRDLIRAIRPEHDLDPQELTRLPAHALLLWGQLERVFQEEQRHFFERHLPKHVLMERPERFGHSPHLDETETLGARLLDFWRERCEVG